MVPFKSLGYTIDAVVVIAALCALFIKYPAVPRVSSFWVPACFITVIAASIPFTGISSTTLFAYSSFGTAGIMVLVNMSIFKSNSNNTAHCHVLFTLGHILCILRVCYLPSETPIFWPVISVHILCAWNSINSEYQQNISYYIKDIVLFKGFKLAIKNHIKGPLGKSDITNEEFSSDFDKKCNAFKLDYTKRFFIIRGILTSEWKTIARFIVSKSLYDILDHYSYMLLISIISDIGDNNNNVHISVLIRKLLIWCPLKASWSLDLYALRQIEFLENHITHILEAKANSIFMSSHIDVKKVEYQDKYNSYISNSVTELLKLLSLFLAQSFNIYNIFSKIGWYAVIPIVIEVAHTMVSQFVGKRAKYLRKLNRPRSMPLFKHSFELLAQNFRTIKFYAWDKYFGNVSDEYDAPNYYAPLAWRVLDHLCALLGCALSQIGALIIMRKYISTFKTIKYVDVTLLVHSISILTRFVCNIAKIGNIWQHYKEGSLFYCKLLSRKDCRYIDNVSENLHNDGITIELDNCEFSWGEDKFSLNPISLTVKSGNFVTIVGQIGSGKSSFLEGLCGDMPVVDGQARIYGIIGYVSQRPWIMNASFKENVLMGADYDEKLYNKVIQASVLTEDIQQFPAGDLTEIGPNGVNLSGGQKVRLALARALYLQADIYIFDDLLSAVDAHVEQQIVEQVLVAGGIISDKTRILVTHANHVVPLSNIAITIADGQAEIKFQTPTKIDTFAIIKDDNVHDQSDMPDKESADIDESAGKFTISPEKDSIFHTKPLLWFLKNSGYGSLALVLGIQLVNAFAIYYSETIRMQLMIDNNPDTLTQSLVRFLQLQALLNVADHQITIIEEYVVENLWSIPVSTKLRRILTKSLLTMPLPIAEGLSYETLSSVFTSDRYRIVNYLPEFFCHYLVNNGARAIIYLIQMLSLTPLLAILCIITAVISFVIYWWYDETTNLLWNIKRDELDTVSGHVNSILFKNRMLLRVHHKIAYFMNKFNIGNACSIYSRYCFSMVQDSLSFLTYCNSVLIKTSILIYYIHQKYNSNETFNPGAIDLAIKQFDLFFHQIFNLSYVSTVLGDQLQALSRYYAYIEGLPKEESSDMTYIPPPDNWPSDGKLTVSNYSMRYRPNLDLAIKKLDFNTCKHEKIGIVGRTGAGKSSISYALMRMVEAASGSIVIDGIDISTLSVNNLRSHISVIPQDPVLFEGTLRENLDPGNEYTDDEVWKAIYKVKIEELLKTPTEKYVFDIDDDNEDSGIWLEGTGLNKWIKGDGEGFSAGQKQLVSLCRALLWHRKIVILDEATANIDSETDQHMQKVIREEFKDCTVLTIAHRLDTVIDSDRILVMSEGAVVEFDTPHKLLANEDSHFSQLYKSMQHAQSNSQ